MWRWSDSGRIPIVVDATSCLYGIKTSHGLLEGEVLRRAEAIEVLDASELVRRVILPRLTFQPLDRRVVVHPTCAAKKARARGRSAPRIAAVCAKEAVVPANLDCCATAGDSRPPLSGAQRFGARARAGGRARREIRRLLFEQSHLRDRHDADDGRPVQIVLVSRRRGLAEKSAVLNGALREGRRPSTSR